MVMVVAMSYCELGKSLRCYRYGGKRSRNKRIGRVLEGKWPNENKGRKIERDIEGRVRGKEGRNSDIKGGQEGKRN